MGEFSFADATKSIVEAIGNVFFGAWMESRRIRNQRLRHAETCWPDIQGIVKLPNYTCVKALFACINIRQKECRTFTGLNVKYGSVLLGHLMSGNAYMGEDVAVPWPNENPSSARRRVHRLICLCRQEARWLFDKSNEIRSYVQDVVFSHYRLKRTSFRRYKKREQLMRDLTTTADTFRLKLQQYTEVLNGYDSRLHHDKEMETMKVVLDAETLKSAKAQLTAPQLPRTASQQDRKLLPREPKPGEK